MTDIPEEFQDVPLNSKGQPDFRTKMGKELKAYLEAQSALMDSPIQEEAGDERFPVAPAPSHGVLSAAEARPGKPVGDVPMPKLGTSQCGQWVLEQLAAGDPEARYVHFNRVKATFVHAQRNLLAWGRLTQGR